MYMNRFILFKPLQTKQNNIVHQYYIKSMFCADLNLSNLRETVLRKSEKTLQGQ